MAGAILGWHGQGSLAKFYPQCAKFYAASTSHFHLFTLICCHHPALLPDHGMPPWDLPPPSAAPLRRRPLGNSGSPSHIPPTLFHWNKLTCTQFADYLINLSLSFSQTLFSIYFSLCLHSNPLSNISSYSPMPLTYSTTINTTTPYSLPTTISSPTNYSLCYSFNIPQKLQF